MAVMVAGERKLVQSLRALSIKVEGRLVPVTARAQLSAWQVAVEVATRPARASRERRVTPILLLIFGSWRIKLRVSVKERC